MRNIVFTEQIKIVEFDKHKIPSFFLKQFAWKPVFAYGNETKTTVYKVWLRFYWSKMTFWSSKPELEDNFLKHQLLAKDLLKNKLEE